MKKLKTLKKNYEFKNTLTKGKFYKGNYVTIYITENKISQNVIGIAVSKKLCKAVKRNKLKRLIRESYRLQKDNIKKQYNIVFLCNKDIDVISINFKDINKDILNLFNRAGIFK